MKYQNVKQGKFINRPNRFLANIEIDGEMTVCHVKNTGRLRELLYPGAEVFLEESKNPNRKTGYDVIGAKKGAEFVNVDSQAPNRVVLEWLRQTDLLGDIVEIKPEKTYGNSRFDFYIRTAEKEIYMEVKGVTLEIDGSARFPDAPTERGVKHIRELIACRQEGYEAYILFVIQMKGIHCFMPNDETHPAFGAALREAAAKGVHILAWDCAVSPDELRMDAPVAVILDGE